MSNELLVLMLGYIIIILMAIPVSIIGVFLIKIGEQFINKRRARVGG